MSNELIYLDNNATTRIDPAVVEEMTPFLTSSYGNPSSAYRFGRQVADAIGIARERVAAFVGCDSSEIVFTSCGTESTNTAIASALRMDPDRQHIVTTRVEHSATLKTCDALAKRGQPISWLGVNSDGQIDLAELDRAITDETVLVSVMWANNETGVMFPIEKIAQIVRSKGAVFHTDAVQVAGKMPLRISDMDVNLLSLSGHKLYAPKGVGVLYVNKRAKYFPFLTGGGQEAGRRAGTENVAGIVALGKACELAASGIAHEVTEVKTWRDEFESAILERVEGVRVNGDRQHRLPNTTSLAFDGVESEAMLLLLDQKGVCCSAGSACTTGQHEPSHVLRAMGFDDTRARSSLRFSFGRFNSQAEVSRAVQFVEESVHRARQVAAAA